MLDKFDINEFYVPPYLAYGKEIMTHTHENNKYATMGQRLSDDGFDDWKHIFERSNIVYVTGGAGYGKSLFMKKLIGEYEKLHIVNAKEYMVIYGELKNFFGKNTKNALSVMDFLQYSMQKETLIEDSRISMQLIQYYLNRGRCIVLLDALDEVDKEKRQELHSRVITYFRNQNPNNKVCITSRARGFFPEKGIEVFDISPLNQKQIQTYVDNLIRLGKFDKSDKDAFLQQALNLVDKGFLNSFLVLSLLINIYKAERELPENKLELYQKCFEYISNKREKEKSQEKYNWNLISTLMKDNTFMELANLCLPNNRDVNKQVIKETLTRIYKTKYVSENETELAIDQFLIFCSDRTELFVPASGEDCFKFFHRSFFEYFYSQYIFIRLKTVEEIYNAWKMFDVDSEVFELTIAMIKQKDEMQYQALVEFLLDRLNEKTIKHTEKVNILNMLILCMQVIDDEVYKKQFVEFLINNTGFCKKNIEKLHNQEHIVNIISANEKYKNLVIENYEKIAKYEGLTLFVNTCSEVTRYQRRKDFKQILQGKDSSYHLYKFILTELYKANFYTKIYYSERKFSEIMKDINKAEIDNLGHSYGATSSQISKLQASYSRFSINSSKLFDCIDKLFSFSDDLQ